MEHKDVVIVGAGPAGIACALQLRRSGIEPHLIECGEPGGLLLQAHFVENYPGFPSGISGAELVGRFLQQLERFSVPVHAGRVEAVENSGKGYLVRTERKEFGAKEVVLATGTKSKMFDIVPDAMNGFVHYDIRPLLHFQDKRIAVIGGGDAAFDYALALAGSNHVSVIFRKRAPSCLRLLHDRVDRMDSIEVVPHCEVDGFQKAGAGIMVKCGGDGGPSEIFDHILCAIGRTPNIELLSESIREQCERGETIPGLYFIGDVARGNNRQVAIAVGDGIRTAMEIERNVRCKGEGESG